MGDAADAARDDEGREELTAEPYTGSTAVVHHRGGHVAAREVRMDVIRPLNPEAVVSSMREHQKLLEAILDPSDWQGQPEARGSFVKKSGWRKIALAYNLTLECGGESVERVTEAGGAQPVGWPLRATFTARAIAANGRGVEARGHCSYEESRFKSNATKLENDLRATAETRAKNRAISDLIGMGKVSAEEADAGGGGADAAAGPGFGPAATEEQAERLGRALAYLLGGDDHLDRVVKVIAELTKPYGYLPQPAVRAVLLAAVAVREINAPPAEDKLTPEEEAQLAAETQAQAAGITTDDITDAVVVEPPANGRPNADYHPPAGEPDSGYDAGPASALPGTEEPAARGAVPTGLDSPTF